MIQSWQEKNSELERLALNSILGLFYVEMTEEQHALAALLCARQVAAWEENKDKYRNNSQRHGKLVRYRPPIPDLESGKGNR